MCYLGLICYIKKNPKQNNEKKNPTKIASVIIWKDNWEAYEQIHTSQRGYRKAKLCLTNMINFFMAKTIKTDRCEVGDIQS